MAYANLNAVMVRLGINLSEDPSDEIIQEAIASADDIVNSELIKNSIPIPKTSVPVLTRAANYLAAADVLESMNNTDPDGSKSADNWTKRGMDLIESYIQSITNDDPEDDVEPLNTNIIGGSSVQY